MKRSKVVLVAAGLIFFAFNFSAFAQRGRQGNPNPPCFYQNCQLVDNNSDDIEIITKI